MQNAPDAYFWYTITILLAGAIIWILIKYTNGVQKTMDKFEDAISRLIVMTEKHEQRHDYQDEKIVGNTERLSRLESKMDNLPKVSYQRNKQ